MRTPLSHLADAWIALATALTIVALTVLLFLNPLWVGFEQGRSQATAWTGFSEADLKAATDSILADLVFGPPDFDVEVAGRPVLEERERAHMRDVRGVFVGFFRVAQIAAVVALVIAWRRRRGDRLATWRAVRAGSTGLVAVLIAAGAIALVAFDVLFEVFHRLLFAGGSYTFDPRTERLVQLFPFQFWQETAIAVGLVAIVAALVVAVVANRRLSPSRAAPQAAADSASLERSRP